MTAQEIFITTTIYTLCLVSALAVFVIAMNDLVNEESKTSPVLRFLEILVAIVVVCVVFAALITGIVVFVQWVFA